MRDNIEQSFLSRAIIRGYTHYYKYEDAIKLIELCQKNEVPILGIDSFIVTETRTQPLLEHSIDFSDSKDSYEKAKGFLKSKEEYGFVFEVVY